MGGLFLYGPFKREGRHTAMSNAVFDTSLRQQDAEWGVRDIADLEKLAAGVGLALVETVPMPANNLILVVRADPAAGSAEELPTVRPAHSERPFAPVDRVPSRLHSAAESMRLPAGACRAGMPMLDMTATEEIADDARARGNVLRLAAAQALTGANSAVIFATGSIVGATLAPSISFATVPLSMYVLGLAAGTLPTGAISRAYGRRSAFIIGTVLRRADRRARRVRHPVRARSGCSAARRFSAGSMARWRNPIGLPPPTAPASRSGPRRCRG